MRAFTADYELKTLGSLQETLKVLANEPRKWKVFAGGTDLMVMFESGRLRHLNFLNLAPFSELKRVEVSESHVRIGALCTYSQIQSHPIIRKEFPLMVRSGWVTGAKAIQNRGTLGGNIANASPAADTPPSLLAYGAQIELQSVSSVRQLEYADFHLDYKKTQMRPDEIISSLSLPRHQNWTHHYYRKIGTRAFQSISKVAISVAARVRQGVIEEIQIGLASVGPVPLRAQSLENSLRHQKISSISGEVLVKNFTNTLQPIDDIRSTGRYRKSVLERVTSHMLHVLEKPPGTYFE